MLISTGSFNEQKERLMKQPSVFCDASPGEDRMLLLKKNEKIEQAFGELQQEVTYHFATAGRWSQYELLNYVLSHTGPADVYLTTWKINDLVAGNLFKNIQAGNIRQLFTILEKRIPVTAPDAKDLVVSNSAKHKITDNHSKVVVIINEHWGVVINGSANMTINPRIEAGTLCTKKTVAEFTRDWITKEIEDGKPFGR